MWVMTNAKRDKLKQELVNFENIINVYLDRGQSRFQLLAQTVTGHTIILAEEFEEKPEFTLHCYNTLLEALKEGTDFIDLSTI